MAQFKLNEVVLEVPDHLLTPKIRRKLNNGMYEAAEARSVLLAVEEDDRVLELGAGIGYIGCLAAMIVGADNVLSVEANPDMINVIRMNFERNGCADIDLRHGAVVGAEFAETEVEFTQSAAFWASSIGGGGGAKARKVIVPVQRFDDLLTEHEPNVVIMDIEGAEAAFFEADWPAYVRVLLMEIHPKRYSDKVVQKIFDRLSSSGLVYSADLSKGKTLGFLRLGTEI